MVKIKGIKESFEIAGTSIGMGIIGESFNSEGLKSGGEVAGKFIPITVNIGMGSTVIDMVKKLKKNGK